MIAIYAASNPHGPAFLEAALIDRFGSFLLAQSYDMHAWFSSMAHGYVMFFLKVLICHSDLYISSTKACRGAKMNVGGGDSLRDVDSGPYFTYVVYMSWRRPSMQVKSHGMPKDV